MFAGSVVVFVLWPDVELNDRIPSGVWTLMAMYAVALLCAVAVACGRVYRAMSELTSDG